MEIRLHAAFLPYYAKQFFTSPEAEVPNPLNIASTENKAHGMQLGECSRLSEASVMREALHKMLHDVRCNGGNSALSESFIEGLIDEPHQVNLPSLGNGVADQLRDGEDEILYELMRGMPGRPYYHEISQRLLTISSYKNKEASSDYDAGLPFLPACHFGVTELKCTSSLVPEPPKNMDSVDECTKWLQDLDEGNILAILGMRQTVGTISKNFGSANHALDHVARARLHSLFPPSITQLIESSRQLHRPNTKSRLTVAARALAKHAHRGADGFFGVVQGSESEKNEHADSVVHRLIREAAWINIHAFGGVDDARPVVEVRTVEGYGARWSAEWNKDAFSPEGVRFRGFLEPNQPDGHEHRWRH
ncbi:hypothetical protein ACHAWF_011960 [Thalassiosira exigua]